MSQKVVEYSDDEDDLNGAYGTHGKGEPDLTETRGRETDIMSRGKNESLTVRPSVKGKVHERDESKLPRGKVYQDAEQNDVNLGNIPDLNKDQNPQSAEAARDKVSGKERIINGLSLFIAIIAIFIASYTHVCPTQHPEVKYVEHFQEPDEFREHVSKCLSRVDSSEQNITQILFRLERIEEKLDKLVVYKTDISNLVKNEELDNLVHDFNTSLLDHIDVKNEEKKKVFQDEVLKLKTEVDAKFYGIHEKQERELHYLEKTKKEIESEISELQSVVQILKEEVATQLSQHKEILTGLKQSEETLGNRVKHIANETTVLNKATDYIMENIFHKGSMIIVIMINTSLVVTVIIYLFSTRNTHGGINQNVDIEQAHDGVNQKPSPYSTAGRILSKVRANPRLERKLCIISFHEETRQLHMRMTQSVTEQLNKELVECIIRKHEDILEIPKVFLYFLFVDFNERNVILEDPTLGLGDLRLTTVQVIQKMNGRIVILYVRDPNSNNLDSKKLYNNNLASVTTQRELSTLNRISRFISSFESLTDFQKDHLRLIVENELDRR